jgi:hypothetical protein
MNHAEKMFHVIVLGGIALAAPLATMGVTACGGSVTEVGDGDGGTPFPQETASPMDASARRDGATPLPDAFPAETATQIDATPPGFDAFPQEGPPPPPPPPDAGSDGCFPAETALPLDSGCK